MMWLTKRIQPYVRVCLDGEPVRGNGEHMGMATLLIERFMQLQEDALLHCEGPPIQLSIGGVITSILKRVIQKTAQLPFLQDEFKGHHHATA